MRRDEAEQLVQRIGAESRGAYRGLTMWKAPRTYVVICTERASNTQFEIDDVNYEVPSEKRTRVAGRGGTW